MIKRPELWEVPRGIGFNQLFITSEAMFSYQLDQFFFICQATTIGLSHFWFQQ
jgi:hypothetical protein